MTNYPSRSNQLRATIIEETKRFLISLESNGSVEELEAMLLRIKKYERQLMTKESSMIDPEMWKILYKRFSKKFDPPAQCK
jgi:hypothetical protein